MTIREFIDRLMLEMDDIRAEKFKYADYFLIGTEALKTVEAVYLPLFEIVQGTASGSTSEITISNTTDKKYIKATRASVGDVERYNVDYEYVKLNSNSFIPCFGYKADGSGLSVAFSPGLSTGNSYKIIVHYVHSTSYFTNESSELELPENYVLVALNIAKQYLYAKLSQTMPVQTPLPVQGQNQNETQ